MRLTTHLSGLAFAALTATATATTGAEAAEVQLWRLDCGTISAGDLNLFSDSFAYPGQKKVLTDSCYLIRHDADYMLWDTGLPAALIGATLDPRAVLSPSLAVDLPTQLAEIGVTPEKVGRVGISHFHFDHLGQAASFPGATLMIGAADWAALSLDPFPPELQAFADPRMVTPWLGGGGTVQPVAADTDVFGDGSVTILMMPGHTEGETALLVQLANMGPVLLSGDVVHFTENLDSDGVPGFNADRAESLASIDRLKDIAANLGATLVIQHDAADIAKLPAFPAAAD